MEFLLKSISQSTHQLKSAKQVSSPLLWYFSRYLADKYKMPKLSKHHNSKNNLKEFKINNLIYPSIAIHWPSFMSLAQTLFEIPCWEVQWQNFQRATTPKDGICSKVNQYTYSSFLILISWQSLKPLSKFF